MNRAPAFQFYAKDWLSSQKVLTMTLEEEGAYIHLLAHCWDSPDCTLPDDDATLAQLSRMGERWLGGGAAALRKCFVPHPRKRKRLTNIRLLEEHRKYARWRKKSQEGGVRSGQIRREQSKGGSRVVEPEANSSSSSSLREIEREEDLSGLIVHPRLTRKSLTKRKPVLVPMPDGFVISEAVSTWANKQGIAQDLVEREFETFCNDRASKGVQYVDWDRAFMTWLSRKSDFSLPKRHGHAVASPSRPTQVVL